MAAQEIEIEILPDGTVKGDIKGFKGARCKEIAKRLAEIFNAEEHEFSPSSEFYENVGEDVDIRNQY